METGNVWTVRQATPADEGQLRQLMARAGRVALCFHGDNLAGHLIREPFLLAERAAKLRGFLAFFMRRPPQAALVAAGLADDWAISPWLDRLLPRCIAYLRARGEEPVGYCYCSVEKEHGHLIRMAVHPAWQGRGIGTRLLAEAVRFFQQAGARLVTLNTQEENERAQRLYRKFGFRLTGREAVALWRDV